MKQHITKEQLNELNDKQKEELFGWYHQSKGIKCFRVGTHMDMHEVAKEKMAVNSDEFNIGQMIEFLMEHPDQFFWWNQGQWREEYFDIDWNGELCDALWEAVKEVLNDCKLWEGQT